jgi:hypothetical protein
MIRRLVKQILAIIIAVAFIASILYFIPKFPNENILSYSILVPDQFINASSTFYSTAPLTFSNQNFSSIGSVSQPISNIISSTNATNLLQLTNFFLSLNKIKSNESNGGVICLYSENFTKSLCDNANYSWLLFYGTGTQLSLYQNSNSPSLSSITLNSIQNNNVTFVLVYANPNSIGVSSTSSGGGPILRT